MATKAKFTRTTTAKKRSTTKKKNAPWDRGNPKGDHHTHLGPREKAAAKRRAKKAGRPYPNLVDNMRAAREKSK